MNKKITFLSLGGLIAASGAAYYYSSDQGNSLNGMEQTTVTESNGFSQQIGQYLPQSILDFLPDSFSPAKQEIVETHVQTSQIDDQAGFKETAVDAMVEVDSINPEETVDNVAQKITNQENNEQFVEDNPLSENNYTETTIDNLSTKSESAFVEESVSDNSLDVALVDEIQKSINETPQVETNQPIKISETEKISPEVAQMQEKLASIKAKISDLDEEKGKLSEKFQEVLVQNKNLAMKLEKIDEALKEKLK